MLFSLNPEKYRKDFPILSKNIVYFDNACMSLKPRQVIEKMDQYYTEYTACAGRSNHALSKKVEHEVALAREEVKSLINAKKAEEIVFTRNTTEGINLVANSLGLKKGDHVIISDKEHNSNLIPWLNLKKKVGITLTSVKSAPDNTFDLSAFEDAFTKNTKLVSIVHTSNLDGVTNPIKEIAKIAHDNGALLLVDGAQSVPGKKVDVRKLDIDFLSFSGHKMLGPTGTGVLYGKHELLQKLDQFIVGGETVIDSTYDDFVPEKIPNKFEAGLQDYAGIIGLGEACRYLKRVNQESIESHEIRLNKFITDQLSGNKRIRILGPQDPSKRGGIFSFTVEKMDIHHVSKMLDVSRHIMVRSGAHCVHSWFNAHNLKGSVRASLYFYNTGHEAQIFVDEMNKILKL
jgi:cysteine desulfurase/selenocysteine lyase